MAQMVPDIDESQIEHRSEVPVFRALRQQLGSEFTVFHSYPWLRPHRKSDFLVQGEIDFVIVHQKFGVLVLEVKGGDNIEHDGERWYRTHSSRGSTEFQNPFTQAQKNMYALCDIIENDSKSAITKSDFVHGYAVVFPHMDYNYNSQAPYCEKRIVIDRKALQSIKSRVCSAYNAWGKNRRRILRDDQYKDLLEHCLKPQFQLIRRLGPYSDKTAERLQRVTRIQTRALEALYNNPRVLVKGSAGSGKTALALKLALKFASSGKRTLFVCYNAALAKWIRREICTDNTTKKFRSNITVNNFHSLAKEIIEGAGMMFSPPYRSRLESRQFWDDKVPEILDEAIRTQNDNDWGANICYEAIVVDEAQDFLPDWWLTISDSLRRNQDCPLHVFMDPNQSLWGGVEEPDIAFHHTHPIETNCRNTQKIAAASASILDLESSSLDDIPLGEDIKIRVVRSQEEQKNRAKGEVQDLLIKHELSPNQLVLIGPKSKDNGSLSNVSKIRGVSLTEDPEEWFTGDGILVTTARSFKGLEADVVLLYDMAGFNPVFTESDLYVACTRARSLLIAIVHGEQCKNVLQSALYASQGVVSV